MGKEGEGGQGHGFDAAALQGRGCRTGDRWVTSGRQAGEHNMAMHGQVSMPPLCTREGCGVGWGRAGMRWGGDGGLHTRRTRVVY